MCLEETVMTLGPLAFAILPVALAPAILGAAITGYVQTNLVSDIPGLAAITDPNLVNPWGITTSGSSPFWISDNGSGKSTLYNTAGIPQSLVVTMPATGATPTGVVFSGTANFNGDAFIFSTEDGTINGWRGALGTNAEVLSLDTTDAVYKGLATGVTGGNQYLYATDFRNGKIVVFPGTGAPSLPGNFTDPNLPAGYAPFGIQKIGGLLYVTYAVQDGAKHDDVPGAGNGVVDVFDLNGNFVRRLATGGALNSPWGLALAPAGFGGAAGDLLVGNFGDGAINAYNANTGVLLGTLADLGGAALVNDGLWGLTFGNGGNGGLAGSLYLTAGLNGENDGLFARIDVVPDPSTLILVGGGLVLMGMIPRKRRR
jgi:uncharacterized protein (TIGR03118 family)